MLAFLNRVAPGYEVVLVRVKLFKTSVIFFKVHLHTVADDVVLDVSCSTWLQIFPQ